MAASQREIELINRKLEDLQQDSQALHDALSSYVDHVTSVGRLWVEGGGMSSSSYRDISNMLHNSVDFIMDTAKNFQVSPGMNRTDHSQMTGPALSQDMPTSSSSLSSPSSSSYLTQPMSPLADHFLLKLQSRLETVEKEMTHVVEMKEEMDGLKEGMNKVKEEMGDFRDEISGLNTDMKKVKKTKGKIENIQKRVEEYEESRTEMEETISEIRTDHDDLSGQVRQLSDNCEETRVKNHGWLRKFEDRLYKQEQSSLSVTSDLETKIDSFNQRVVTAETRMGEMEREKERESAKVKLLEEKVKDLEKDHDKQELIVERVEELESDMRDVQTIKLEEIEKRIKENVKELEKGHDKQELIVERVEELESDMRDVQTIRLEGIEERVTHLEKEKANCERRKMLEDGLTEIDLERKKKTKSVSEINSESTRCMSKVNDIGEAYIIQPMNPDFSRLADQHAQLSLQSTLLAVTHVNSGGSCGNNPREIFAKALDKEMKRIRGLASVVYSKLPSEDLRLGHIVLYLMCSQADIHTTTIILSEQFSLCVLLDSASRIKGVRQQAHETYKILYHRQNEDGIKCYEFWHRRYHHFRQAVYMFTKGLEAYCSDRYQEALPYFTHAWLHNCEPGIPVSNIATCGINPKMLAYFRRRCLQKLNEMTMKSFECDKDMTDALTVMTHQILPSLANIGGSEFKEDIAVVEEIRERWCQFLEKDLSKEKIERLQDFLPKMFKESGNHKEEPKRVRSNELAASLQDRYTSAMRRVKEKGELDAWLESS